VRYAITILAGVIFSLSVVAQENADGPANEKAQKTYKTALDYLHQHKSELALDEFKKADKQDGGHCLACQKEIMRYAIQFGDWKAAELAGTELVNEAHDPKQIALAHYELGRVWLDEGIVKRKDEFFTQAHEEMGRALATYSNFPDAIFVDGVALGHLNQDDAAKAQFQKFATMRPGDDPDRQRALRYISRPDLVRARMAPAFAVTTLDGQRVSFDDLKGKVVLLDFWATWCAPCREALPHMQKIAAKFQGEPLVILSVSLDDDEQKWKQFITKNEMSWLQYRDGGFSGPISTLFDVKAIPHTFTIDADGVQQEEHVGDASIEGKLKKLIAQAKELQATQQAQATQTKAP